MNTVYNHVSYATLYTYYIQYVDCSMKLIHNKPHCTIIYCTDILVHIIALIMRTIRDQTVFTYRYTRIV